MTAAVPVNALINHVEGMADAVARLHDDHGISVQWEQGSGNVGAYDGFTRVLTLNRDDSLEDQLWVLHEALSLCLIGRHAVPAAETRRHLRPA